MRTAKEWKKFYGRREFEEEYLYEGHDLGVRCGGEGTVFRLWSPCAATVALRLYRDGSRGNLYRRVIMEHGDKGIWSWQTEEELHGVYYDYELMIDGQTLRSADPWARACGVNGARSMAVNLERTNPEGWEEDRPPEPQPEQVIYELHVKEFSWDKQGGFPEEYRGRYKAFLCGDTGLGGDLRYPTGCAYLRRLGVTHIQLMPVYDFGSVDEAGRRSGFNWGYDPVNYNVPEGSYSTDPYHGEVRIREMKEMVQSLHRQGFRVIMDVVYNHTYSLDSWFQRTAPWYYYRVDEEGRASEGSACGNDVASERPMCANFIVDSVLYWAEEYHIDGFRFDLMGLLDVELMNRIRRELDERYGPGEKLVYGEPWRARETAMEEGRKGALKENLALLDENIGIFCDNTRNAVKGSVFQEDREGFVNGGWGLEEDILWSVKAWQGSDKLPVKAPSQIITYISAHDNQTLWDKLVETVPRKGQRRRANRLAAAIYMTCQGRLFFLSGEEFTRTKKGLDDTYNAPISLNRLSWKRAWREEELVDYYRGLIALRKQLPGLCDKSTGAGERITGMWKKPLAVGFQVDNRSQREMTAQKELQKAAEQEAGTAAEQKNSSPRWSRLYIVYNAREEALPVELPGGEWEVLVDDSSSFLWENALPVEGTVSVKPVSALVLGQALI